MFSAKRTFLFISQKNHTDNSPNKFELDEIQNTKRRGADLADDTPPSLTRKNTHMDTINLPQLQILRPDSTLLVN